METYSFPWTSQLVIEYLRRGYEVDLFTSSEAIAEPLQLAGTAGLRLFVGRRRPRARSRGLDNFRLERSDTSRQMREASPDVIHAHWLGEYAAAALAVQRDALVTAHDSPPTLIRYYAGAYWRLRAAFTYRNLTRARNVTAVSESLRRELIGLPFAPRNIEVIPNGIKSAGRARARDALFEPGRPTFGTIANGFDARKNTAVAIRAFDQVRKRLPNARMIMFGAGHGQGEEAQSWAIARGLATGIDFRGRVSPSEVDQALNGTIDVCVHTSVWEAASIAILECQLAGIPVIGGRHSGGVPDALDAGSAGLLVDVSRDDEVANAMLMLAANPDLYGSISSAAAKRFEGNFRIERTASLYLAKLEAIIAERKNCDQ